MPLLFVISGLVTLALLVVLVSSVIAGLALCHSKRHRTVGTFVLLVPTLGVLTAATGSWGFAFLLDSLARTASSPQAWQTWGVLTFWAWPAGFVVGGLTGAGLGTLLSVLIVKRWTPSR